MPSRTRRFPESEAPSTLSIVFDDNAADGGGEGGGGGDLPPEGGDGGQPSPSNPWDSLPQSWTQDLAQHWTKAPPEVRQFVHRREADIAKGFQSYKPKVETYEKLSKLFEGAPQDFDFGGTMETLARNHLLLAQASPAERKELFKQLAQTYGVDFAEAAAAGTGGQGPDPTQRLLQEHIAPIRSTLESLTKDYESRRLQEASRVVDSFFSDPKNKYAQELAGPISELIQKGEAKTLEKAYRLAALDHPEIRGKYLADMAAEAASRPGGQAPGGTRNVRSSSGGAPPASGKTIDDTMKAVLQKHYG